MVHSRVTGITNGVGASERRACTGRIPTPNLTRLLRAAVAGVLGVVLLAVAGCSNTGGGTGNQAATTLTVGATLEPTGLDITAADGAGGPQALLYNVYETLVKINNDGQLVGLLANSWTLSPDRLTYTFALQPRANFANGDPVSGEAVAASINHILHDKAVSPTLKAQMVDVRDVEATGDKSVKVTLKQPSQFWLYNMAGAAGIVVDPSGLTKMATASAGSGPYTLGSWKKGDSVTLDRNTKYWGNEAHFSSVVFKYYTDPNALTTAMKAGDINIISDLTTPDALDQFSDPSQYTVVKGTSNGEVVLGFNHNSPALKDKGVRQAINYAIDRKALLDTVWAGQGTLIGSMVPPTDPYYDPALADYYKYDPAKAKQLLAKAHEKNITLRLRVPNIAYATSAAQFVQASLKAVGIKVVVEQLDFTTWINSVFLKGDYDMTIVNHVEPKDIVKWTDKTYYWHYNNAQFNKLVAEADRSDTPRFVALMKQASRILTTDAAADFLFLFPHISISDADISGIPANATSASFDLTNLASRDN